MQWITLDRIDETWVSLKCALCHISAISLQIRQGFPFELTDVIKGAETAILGHDTLVIDHPSHFQDDNAMTRAKESEHYSHAFRILITPEIRARFEKLHTSHPSLTKNDFLSMRLDAYRAYLRSDMEAKMDALALKFKSRMEKAVAEETILRVLAGKSVSQQVLDRPVSPVPSVASQTGSTFSDHLEDSVFELEEHQKLNRSRKSSFVVPTLIEDMDGPGRDSPSRLSSSLPITIPTTFNKSPMYKWRLQQRPIEEKSEEFVAPHVLSLRSFEPESFLGSHPPGSRQRSNVI